MPLPSTYDIQFEKAHRDFIEGERKIFLSEYTAAEMLLLDVGNKEKFSLENDCKLETLDISPEHNPDYVGDITRKNYDLSDGKFDAVMCAEVLEHVVDPFSAIRELHRILKCDGHLFITVPLNARIHGPVPDCWRFTEFGLNVMFRDWEILRFSRLDTPGRNLFPLHYALVAKKISNHLVESDPRLMKFTKIE